MIWLLAYVVAVIVILRLFYVATKGDCDNEWGEVFKRQYKDEAQYFGEDYK